MTEKGIARIHIENEVMKLYRSRRNNLVALAVVVILVAAYLTWIDREISYWSQPQNIVLTASGVVESNIPAMKRSAEALIRQEAPRLARHVGNTVSREVPVLIRNMLEQAVLDYSRKLADLAVVRYTEAFEGVVRGTLGDLSQILEIKVDAERERRIVLALEKQFQTTLRNLESGQGEDTLEQKLAQSHIALRNLHEKLQKVAAQDDSKVGRRDQLTRRFLGTFWRYMQQENPDIKATP